MTILLLILLVVFVLPRVRVPGGGGGGRWVPCEADRSEGGGSSSAPWDGGWGHFDRAEGYVYRGWHDLDD